jgi:TolB-like protein
MNRSDAHPSACPELNRSAIAAELEKILASRTLARATFLNRFLKCCVEQTLAGHSNQLKELWIGTTVFQRKGRFNPVRDPIVRVQARRLRQKLDLYYSTEGLMDRVRIIIPVGSYVPMFSVLDANIWAAIPLDRSVSVAVLPLSAIDNEPESTEFADQMTSELTTKLGASSRCEAVSRTSALAFKGAAQDIPPIGRSLGPDFIVRGFTRLADRKHRITLLLTATETGCYCGVAWFEQRKNGSPADARSLAQLLRLKICTQATGPNRASGK